MVVLLVGCLKASSSVPDEMDHHSEELKEEMKAELREEMKVEELKELKMEAWFHHWWNRGTMSDGTGFDYG